MKKILCLLAAVAGASAFAGFGDALDCADLTFTSGGDAEWREQSSVVKIGDTALQSGAIDDDKESWIETTAPTNGMLSFWWSVNSEGGSCDYLELTVAGEAVDSIGGAWGWTKKSIFVKTGQKVRWRYCKDSSWSDGADCGWLDGLMFEQAPDKMRLTFETNGGEAVSPVDVEPGSTFEELPYPVRDGNFEFDGWYLDEELTERVNREDLVPFHDVTLYARWVVPVAVLNSGDLSFDTNYGEYWYPAWEAVEDAEATGGYALRGPVDSTRLRGDLLVDWPGPGALSFKWKVDGNTKGDGYFELYLGNRYETFSGSSAWQEQKVYFYGSETELDFISYGTDSALMLKDFAWTDAPEKMTVEFDANGGAVSPATREYVPQDTYVKDGVKLPVPTRKGFTFLGWRFGSVDGAAVLGEDKVPLEANIKLVAKWGQPVSALNTKQLTNFTSTGADKWFAVYSTDAGAYSAEAEPKGKVGVVTGSCGPQGGMTSTSSTLQTTTAAAGYLTFSWSLKNGGNTPSGNCDWRSAVEMHIYLDGKEIESASLWRFNDETGERQSFVYIPSGKHTLKWVAKGHRAYRVEEGYWDYVWNDDLEDYEDVWVERPAEFGTAPLARVWGFSFEPAASQPDLQTWGSKLRTYKSWRTGDLAKFAAFYKTRMIADAEDYEARILFAASRLGVLAENAQFKAYAKTFGLTVDWARMSVTPPTPKFDKNSAAMNAMADKTLALATPAIREAQDALAGIPENWAGSVTLDAAEWPLDETISIDSADVLFARAGLDAALAGLNFLGAYDLTLNYPKVQATVNLVTKIPAVKATPKVNDAAGWEKSGRCFRTVLEGNGGTSEGTGAMVVNGTTLSLRLGYVFGDGFLNETNQIHDFDFYLKSGSRKFNIWGRIYGEHGSPQMGQAICRTDEYGQLYCEPPGPSLAPGNYVTKTNVVCYAWDRDSDEDWTVPATIQLRDGAMILNVNLSKVNLGTKKKPVKFSAKSWSVSSGEVGVSEWYRGDYARFDEEPDEWWDDVNEVWMYPYWDDESGEWVDLGPEDDPADYPPQYEWYTRRTGSIRWEAQSDAERRVMKFVNDQTAFFSKVRDASRLSASRRHFRAALERALVADGKALDRTGDDMHFFEYDPDNRATIDFARANTERALSALDSPLEVDFAEVAAEFDATGVRTNRFLASEYNYTLLPNEGVTRVFLGALFRGGVTRALLPPMRANAYGEIVPDFDAMTDPTIGGLFPDMTHGHVANLSGRFEEKRELDHGEPTDVESLPKPGEKLSFTYAQYKGYTVSGLPKGWTWNSKTGVLSGTASATFKLTFSKKGKPSESLTVEIGPRPAVLLFSDDESAVAVTGSGVYNVGATAKATAAVKPGYAFLGWYDTEGNLEYAGAVYSFKMTRADKVLMAKTTTLAEDRLYAKTADEFELEIGDEVDLTPFHVLSGTPFTVSVSGLPAGLSAVAAVEQQIDGFECDTRIVGAPTKAGVYYASFVAKNNGGFKWNATVKFVVGGAQESGPNTAGIDLSMLDYNRMIVGMESNYAFTVPASAKGSAPKSVKVKGLPGGVKASLSSGALRIGGIPATAGKFTLDVTVTYADKKTARAVKTYAVNDMGSVYIKAAVVDNDPSGAVRGTVTGGGVKNYGQTVAFTAAPANKKTLFFAGWYLYPECDFTADAGLPGVDWRAAAVSAQLTDYWSGGDGMYARFVTKAEEAAEGVVVESEDFWRVFDADGVATQLPVEITSATKPTLTANGLPAGTKISGTKLVVSKASALVPGWYTVTLTAKTAAGNTATKKVSVLVPNATDAIDKGVLSGLYTGDDGYTTMDKPFMKAGVKQTFTLDDLGVSVAEGWTLAVTGLPKGWTYNASTKTITGAATKVGKTTVTFTVSKKSGKKVVESHKATATFVLEPLAEWAVGTYVGMVGNAVVRMDVASNGSVSGYRFDTAGKKTFTASGFTANETGTLLSATLAGKGVSMPVDLTPVGNFAVQQGVAKFNGGLDLAYNSPWCLEGADPLPVFAEDASVAIAEGRGTLTLKFDNKGVVTYKYQVGKNATSGTTQICDLYWDYDSEEWTATAAVSLAAKLDSKKKVLVPALVRAIPLKFRVDGSGNAAVEVVGD